MLRLTQFLSVFVLSLALISPLAHARESVPVINHENVTWTNSKGMDMAEIRNRIMQAAQSKKWTVSPGPSADSLIGTLVVRNKHTVRVEISYGASAFSVKYLDSINMNYKIEEPNLQPDPFGYGQEVRKPFAVIHPFYNRWVQELVDTIRQQLQN